jgi:hypothetical protein
MPFLKLAARRVAEGAIHYVLFVEPYSKRLRTMDYT